MRRPTAAAAVAVMMVTGASAEVVKPADIQFADGAVEQSLTGEAGDPAKGREHFAGRKLGNCLACHQNADLEDEQQFHGEVGPPLNGVAGRYSEAQLRGIVVNAKNMFDGTIMPAFYKDSGYTRPLDKFEGKTILDAQQVEDIVAYLMTLKDE